MARVFYGDQKSRMEALKSYTINGAFAAFEEGSKGSLDGRQDTPTSSSCRRTS